MTSIHLYGKVIVLRNAIQIMPRQHFLRVGVYGIAAALIGRILKCMRGREAREPMLEGSREQCSVKVRERNTIELVIDR